MSFLRRGSSERRGAATFVLLAFVGLALVVVFAGTLARSSDLEAEAEVARVEVAALRERVQIGRAEVDFIDTEAFVEQVARTIGYGTRGERPFALEADAPSPAPVVPIGSRPGEDAERAPLEAWLDLLFGA
jgi:hypothetical protein